MTMTLAHPAADLGRFVEGTLDDAARAAVVEHIADCDECRIVVVDTSEFIEPARAARPWWLASAAAALLLVAAVGTFTYTKYHDPLAKLTEDYAQLKGRPIEGRLSMLPYLRWSPTRGPSGDEVDIRLTIMQGDAASAAELSGNDARALHAHGIGVLLEGNDTAGDSLPSLKAAAAKEPDNARYQSDLAAALIAAANSRDTAKLQLAVEAADRALKIDPHSLEALFNRALALELLDRKQEAIAAYNRYLALDSSSKWADEVRQHLDNLRYLLPPS